MQTTRYLVGTFVKFTTCVKYCHNDFECGFVKLFMHINRDTTTIVFYGDRIVFIDCNFNVCTISSHGFINGVVNGLVDQMVETLF
ncbi:uncharacterized protein BN731_00542 [Prevotella sp. CAG:604]|nr:uncharacterized protein BN731_00542 [Prevotella sp. CAG:604]